MVALKPSALLWAARGGLGACAVVTAIFAFSPPHAGLHLLPWDKADHFAAFFALMTAASVSFPKHRLVWIAVWVSAAGAAIELIQGLPSVHRDCDIWDWVTDDVAIGAVIGLIIAARIRRWLNGSDTLSQSD